jgi:hypothetical protein
VVNSCRYFAIFKMGRNVVALEAQKGNVSILTAILLLSLNIFGCASQETRSNLRASGLLINKNPVKKIAIVGTAQVMRPRMGGKDSILSLSSSKMLLEDSLPRLKSAFNNKGYQVVYAEPAGVGYYWRGPDDYWVYDYSAKKKGVGSDKWRVESMNPVYVYPGMKKHRLIGTAARKEFERLNDYISMGRLPVYLPDYDNVTTIAKQTHADTVCFARLWGERYSTARKVGDFALKVAVALLGGGVSSGGLKEYKEVSLVCANAKAKQLVWMNTHVSGGDPIAGISDGTQHVSQENSAADTFFEQAITTLPNAGQSFPGDCRVTNRARKVVSCGGGGNASNQVAQSN